MQHIRKIFIAIIILIVLYLMAFPIRFLIKDFGIQNIFKTSYALLKITLTNKQYYLIEEKDNKKSYSYVYLVKSDNYLETISIIMKSYGYIPDNVGMLGERIPYNSIEGNKKISIYHGSSKYYAILKFEKDI